MVDPWEEGWSPGPGHWVDLLGKILYLLSTKVELIDVRELNPGVIQSTEQYTFIFSRFMPGEPKYCSVSSSEQLLLTSTILFLLGLLRLSIACGL